MNMHTDLVFQIKKGIKEKRHLHAEIEIIFVIEGQVKVEIKDTEYKLEAEDIILINSSIMHSLECEDEAIICYVQYPYQMFSKIIKNANCIFSCNSVSNTEHPYEELRNIFHELIYHDVQQLHRTDCLKNSLLYKLLDYLIENYILEDHMENMNKVDDDVRLQQIITYVNSNFQYKMSLFSLAEELYVSTSTLSRFFRKQTGIYFTDYVKQVRMRYAMQDLLYSDANITKIAVDCGLSNPSAFNRVFRDVYGISPSGYRKKMQKSSKKKESEEQAFREKIRQELKEKELIERKLLLSGKIILNVDAEQGSYYEKNWNKVVNISSVYNLTFANLQSHTLLLKEHLGFQYVRLWNVFSQNLMITDGKRIGNYNYNKIDGVLDFLVSHHIFLFLDFGKRPDTAMKMVGKSVFRVEECIEFQSREIWEAMLKDFLYHIINRYGKEEVSRWIFEFSCDCDRIQIRENRYYLDENYDYFNAFQYAYKEIKTILPNMQVGGPMGFCASEPSFLKRFLSLCKEQGCIPDFLSFVLFPYEIKVENEIVVRNYATKETFEIDSIKAIRNIMKEMKVEDCKLYIVEWNNSLSSRNYLNDSCFRAAYIARKMSEIWNLVDLICIWVGSDWVSSYYDTVKIANGGNGLLTKDSIRKPAYFALQFMKDLGEYLIEKGENYIITRNQKNDYYLLCFNFKWYGYKYFLKEEYLETPDMIEGVFDDNNPLELNIIFNNMPTDLLFAINKKTINNNEGSILSEWKKFQYDDLQDNDVKYIEKTCFPRMSMEKKMVMNGKMDIKVTLQEHEVTLLHIYEYNKV
jgi:xylan 1,4-beta-xylosidase